MKILVVDDENTVVSLLIAALSPPHNVSGITGGADVVSWVRNHEYDLVLLDIMLPDSNGFALLRQLKAALPNVLVILMTGAVDAPARDKALAAGADEFLTKPLNLSHLRSIIENFQKGRSQR